MSDYKLFKKDSAPWHWLVRYDSYLT